MCNAINAIFFSQFLNFIVMARMNCWLAEPETQVEMEYGQVLSFFSVTIFCGLQFLSIWTDWQNLLLWYVFTRSFTWSHQKFRKTSKKVVEVCLKSGMLVVNFIFFALQQFPKFLRQAKRQMDVNWVDRRYRQCYLCWIYIWVCDMFKTNVAISATNCSFTLGRWHCGRPVGNISVTNFRKPSDVGFGCVSDNVFNLFLARTRISSNKKKNYWISLWFK